jgi:ribulose-5-phosphate 4-epimerase/fuculose-1-phosphate aldolase
MTIKIGARTSLLVATATRALAVANIFDMHGHVSVRDGEVAYVNGHSASRIAVTPEEIAIVRIADGETVEGTPPSEIPIHLSVYRSRADVAAVVHFHAMYATSLSVAGKPLVAAFNAGAPFGREVPVFDDPRLIRSDDQGRRLAGLIGRGSAVLLRGHGAVVVAADLPSAVALALQLEESAHRLWLTYAIGEPRRFSDDELASVGAQLAEPRVARKIWIDAVERARRAGALDGLDVASVV